MLVSIGVIPEEAAKESDAGEMLDRIERTFTKKSYREFVNPNVKIGSLMWRWREEIGLTQAETITAMHQELTQVGISLTAQSNFSRLQSGEQRLTYVQAMAFLRIVRQKTGLPIPGDFLSPWEEDRSAAEALLVDRSFNEID